MGENKAVVAIGLAKECKRRLLESLPTNGERVFLELIKEQPNRGKDFEEYSVKLLNYWSRALDAAFGLRYDAVTLLDCTKQ